MIYQSRILINQGFKNTGKFFIEKKHTHIYFEKTCFSKKKQKSIIIIFKKFLIEESLLLFSSSVFFAGNGGHHGHYPYILFIAIDDDYCNRKENFELFFTDFRSKEKNYLQ